MVRSGFAYHVASVWIAPQKKRRMIVRELGLTKDKYERRNRKSDPMVRGTRGLHPRRRDRRSTRNDSGGDQAAKEATAIVLYKFHLMTYNNFMDTINLDNLKKARGLRSAASVAKQLNISKQQLWNYENGLSDMPVRMLVRIANLYGVNAQELINQNKAQKVSNIT